MFILKSSTESPPCVRPYHCFLLILTGILGVAGEVFFYSLVKIGRTIPFISDLFFSFNWQIDGKLNLGNIWQTEVYTFFGQCSLWMMPVYAVSACYIVRPLMFRLIQLPFLVRGIFYGIGITIFEGLAGLVYQKILGFSVWTYTDDGAFLYGATTWRIVPLWILVGLFTEILMWELSNPVWREAFGTRLKAISDDESVLSKQLGNSPKVSEVRSVILPELFKINNFKAWAAVFRTLVLAFTGIFATLTWLQIASAQHYSIISITILTLPASWLLGQIYVGWFVIGHDCGHGAFSRRRWVNTLIGHLAMGWIGLSFEGWRIVHNFHHAHTQIKGIDPDWAENQMTREEFKRADLGRKIFYLLGYSTPIGVLVGIWHGNLRKNILPFGYPQIPLKRKQIVRTWLGTLWTLLMVASVSLTFYWLGGTRGLIFCYILPLILGGVSGTLITFLHHTRQNSFVFNDESWTASRGQILSTFEVRFPRWLEWLWNDINIHLPHHISPKIPWYHLKKASDKIHNSFDGIVNPPTQFSLKALLSVWKQPFLRELKDIEKE
jgi:omega-6 fatty acid desaturase (delta-12 desaturase)